MASQLPELLTSAERTSHLTRALHDLLLTPLPPEALPALARIAWVAYLDVSQSADTIGDMLGVEPATPTQDRLSGYLHLDGIMPAN